MLPNLCKCYWNKRWSKSVWRHFTIGLVILLTTWGFGIGFFVNLDQSLPCFLFVAQRDPHAIPRGAYVLFDHTVLGEKKRLVKKVFGVYADSIVVKNNEVWINDILVGKLKSHSKTGIPFSTILPHVIPEGFLFVAGTHPDSFDSRYEAFGLISEKQVVARAYPLF